LSRARGRNQRIGGLKRDSNASSSNAYYYYYRKARHIKKNCMKYKKMLKKKGDKDSDGASTSGKSDQAVVIENAEENACHILTAQLGKKKYSDAWLLDSGRTYHMYPKREWFSIY